MNGCHNTVMTRGCHITVMTHGCHNISKLFTSKLPCVEFARVMRSEYNKFLKMMRGHYYNYLKILVCSTMYFPPPQLHPPPSRPPLLPPHPHHLRKCVRNISNQKLFLSTKTFDNIFLEEVLNLKT